MNLLPGLKLSPPALSWLFTDLCQHLQKMLMVGKVKPCLGLRCRIQLLGYASVEEMGWFKPSSVWPQSIDDLQCAQALVCTLTLFLETVRLGEKI